VAQEIVTAYERDQASRNTSINQADNDAPSDKKSEEDKNEDDEDEAKEEERDDEQRKPESSRSIPVIPGRGVELGYGPITFVLLRGWPKGQV
jgi:hypothetical protein